MNVEKNLPFHIEEIGKLQAEIQAHRKIAPTVHARPDLQMLDKGKGAEAKKAKYFVLRESF